MSSTPEPLLLRLARASRIAPFWQAIAARCARVEEFVGSAEVETRRLQQGHVTWMTSALRGLDDGAAHAAVVGQAERELLAFAETLGAQAQWKLFAELRRGLDPRGSLDTWSDEHFFSRAEIDVLDGLDRALGAAPAATRSAGQTASESVDGRKKVRLVQWSPGADADYGGYVCVIMKVTRHCNLRCTYCHDWRVGRDARMTFEVMAHATAKALRAREHAVIDFVWHGGEPTLIGRRGALRLLRMQRRFARNGQTVNNILQTNGAALDETWAQFFADFGFAVNVSLDGPPEIHERTRPQADGAGTYQAVRRGLALLRERGLARGVLMVVGDALCEYGAEQLVAFLQAEELTEVGLLPVRPGNPPTASSQPYLAPARYARFLADVHRARLARPTPWIHVREIDMVVGAHAGVMPTHCEMLGNCVGAYFSVEPSGEVAHCDKFVGDPNFTLGNVLRDDFATLRASAKAAELRADARSSQEACASCPHHERCRGWCPHERYVAERIGLGRAGACCGLGPLFDALDELRAQDAAE